MKGDSEEMSGDSSSQEVNVNEIEVVQEAPSEEKKTSKQFNDWMQEFQKETAVEKKIRLAIDFMRAALSQGETPRFKDFWEGRRLCLPLFKENIPVKIRTQLWSEYVELSDEARRLKDLLDEQSAFAVEQIELAIQSIERDLENYAVVLEQSATVVFPQESVSLKGKIPLYQSQQKELQVLNTLSARINSMRKEIIKTEMRIRIKNKLLERLSKCGDGVFPKRKELIKNISKEFTEDVERFVAAHFKVDEIKNLPLHVLREEIKLLQQMAKILTLNTQAFTATRLKLSECWDKIKTQEKDRKKEIIQKKQTHKQNYDLVMEKIAAFAEECLGEMTLNICNERTQALLDFMRTVELGRDEVKSLKDEIAKAKKDIVDRERQKEEQRINQVRENEIKRKEAITAFKDELNTLPQRMDQYTIEELTIKRDELLKQFDQLVLSKMERQIIERSFKQLKDAMAGKREKALLSLSEDDLKSLTQLKELLSERMERRAEIKNQLEHYRKALGGSGFDFEKALMYQELIETEKMSLEKIDDAIQELEQKIEEIEG